MKYFLLNLITPFYKVVCNIRWKKKWNKYIRNNNTVNLIVGAGNTRYENWFPTDIQIFTKNYIQINVFNFDITNESHYNNKLKGRKINKILAEHVFEHLSTEQIENAILLFDKYSSENVSIRIAVPDGYHNNSEYIDMVKPGGTGEGADEHLHLFTYQSLADVFSKFGFDAKFIEYWDEKGKFHSTYSNEDGLGYIKRCSLNDKRNTPENPFYTSLIIDFRRKKES